MTSACRMIQQEHGDKIEEVVDVQRTSNREAIFFIYKDGTTTKLFKGGPTSISLSPDEEKRIIRQGNITASVHSHPGVFNPSTIDIMTGIITRQDHMCVATPVEEEQAEEGYVLTCFDLSGLNELDRQRLFRAMRRSSISVFETARQLRKQINVGRFNIEGCRTRQTEIDGVKYPFISRPSVIEFEIGREQIVTRTKQDTQ